MTPDIAARAILGCACAVAVLGWSGWVIATACRRPAAAAARVLRRPASGGAGVQLRPEYECYLGPYPVTVRPAPTVLERKDGSRIILADDRITLVPPAISEDERIRLRDWGPDDPADILPRHRIAPDIRAHFARREAGEP